jgi:hypothetical protein
MCFEQSVFPLSTKYCWRWCMKKYEVRWRRESALRVLLLGRSRLARGANSNQLASAREHNLKLTWNVTNYSPPPHALPPSYLQKASVGPSYNCCLRAYAIALLFFYDLASEKPRFTGEVEAGDIRGIDVWESTRGTSQGILLEQTDHCGAARTREREPAGHALLTHAWS